MSHDPSASPVESTSEPKLIRVTLKSSGKACDCQVNEKSTIAELKNEAGRHFLLSKEQVLLIFAGKILKDQESLLQHGIQSGDMVHVVAKRPELRPNHALQTRSVTLGTSVPGTAAGTSESAGGVTLQPLLRNIRRDLLTLLDIFSEIPQHFQHHPELMFQVVQSSTVQGLLSKETNPLTVTFILGVSSLVSLRVMQSRAEKEEEFSDKVVPEALEEPFVQNILANTKEMAQFLSENPELKTFAQETPQFGRLLSLSGLTKMMVIYKKLPQLVGTVTMPDMSLEADMLDDLQSFCQLFVDIRQVLSSPGVQDELEERMLRHTIETSHSLIQLAKENARIGHLLSNPKVVGEIIRYIQKPKVKQEMDRHYDRILSNIESFPGGYNILQRMYKEMEEPIWSVMEQQYQNPFATQGGSPASNQAVLPPRIENRMPLPDPWVPRQLQTGPQAMGKANHQRGAAEEGNLHPEKVSKGTQVDFSLESSQTEDLPEVPNASPESSTSFLQDGEAPATESPASQAPVLQSQDLQVLPGLPNASPREGLSSQELVETEDNLETSTETPPGSKFRRPTQLIVPSGPLQANLQAHLHSGIQGGREAATQQPNNTGSPHCCSLFGEKTLPKALDDGVQQQRKQEVDVGQEGPHQGGPMPAKSIRHGEASHWGVVKHPCRDVGDAGAEGLQVTFSRADAQDEDKTVKRESRPKVQSKTETIKAVESCVCTREPDQVGVQAAGESWHVGPAEGQLPPEKRQWDNARAYPGDPVSGQEGGLLQRLVDGDEAVKGPEHLQVHDGEAVDEEQLAEASAKANLPGTEDQGAQHGGEGGEGHPQLAHGQHEEEEIHGFV
ncbi:hypothetical protein L345_12592, partial [Ophiophagus hannah]